MPVGPNTAFLLLILGMLAIYCEFIWPGRIVPGVLGSAAALAGAYFLFRHPLHLLGLIILAAGVVLLTTEALAGPYYIFGLLGTIALAAGFALLFPGPRRLTPALEIPVSACFGAVTTLLASLAKRARRNKRSDVTGPTSRNFFSNST